MKILASSIVSGGTGSFAEAQSDADPWRWRRSRADLRRAGRGEEHGHPTRIRRDLSQVPPYCGLICLLWMEFSEVHYSRSASIADAVASIRKNNGVALKGVIQEAYTEYAGELHGLNMRLRRELDLFANVVHIKVCASPCAFISCLTISCGSFAEHGRDQATTQETA